MQRKAQHLAGLDRREVESLAKTMEVKFSVSGPAIGGAKSGIDFDPADPRKNDVLRRWYKAVTPLLKKGKTFVEASEALKKRD